MKAIVLAGGAGRRLRPITHTSAKQLVPVANKPVLFYGLEAIRDAGITEVGVIVGDTAAEIQAAVGDGSTWGLDVTYIWQADPLGLAHCVLIAADFLGDDDFLMYLGDNFVVGGITDLVERFRRSGADSQILLTRVPDPGQFGVAELDQHGRVVGLEEKPKDPKSDLGLVGVYMFTAAVHRAVRAISPSKRGELEITDAIGWLLGAGYDVRSHVITGYWKDTGRLEDMLECNRAVLETFEQQIDGAVDERSAIVGRVVIEPGAQVVNSTIRGPAVIGAGTRVVDSYVGPFTSVAADCVLNDTEIEYSIVLGEAIVRGVRRVEHSLIGRQVDVTPAPRTLRAHRLMLGDHSKVQISS